MPHIVLHFALAAVITAGGLLESSDAAAQNAQIERGKYLVTLGGCNDCPTPGYFFGKPDATRILGGSDRIPGLGVFHGPISHLITTPAWGNGQWMRL